MRQISLLLLIITTCVFKINAQDSIRIARDSQLQQMLGMNKKQYQSYRKDIKKFDKRMFEIIRDTSMDKNVRMVAMAKVMGERRTWLQQHLTEEQRTQLTEFHRRNFPDSPPSKQRKEMEERLKKRGMTVKHATDSL